MEQPVAFRYRGVNKRRPQGKPVGQGGVCCDGWWGPCGSEVLNSSSVRTPTVPRRSTNRAAFHGGPGIVEGPSGSGFTLVPKNWAECRQFAIGTSSRAGTAQARRAVSITSGRGQAVPSREQAALRKPVSYGACEPRSHPCEEIHQHRDGHRLGGELAPASGGDPGQHRDERRQRLLGVDECPELAEDLTATHLDGTDLGDSALGGLPPVVSRSTTQKVVDAKGCRRNPGRADRRRGRAGGRRTCSRRYERPTTIPRSAARWWKLASRLWGDRAVWTGDWHAADYQTSRSGAPAMPVPPLPAGSPL